MTKPKIDRKDWRNLPESVQRLLAEGYARQIAYGVDAYYDKRTCVTCGVFVKDTCPINQAREGEPIPCEPERNLREDMSICSEATQGIWEISPYGNFVGISVEDRFYEIAEYENIHDARFIAEARTGWPRAIERALQAEETAAYYQQAYALRDTDWQETREYLQEAETERDALRAERVILLDYIHELETENHRLQSKIDGIPL